MNGLHWYDRAMSGTLRPTIQAPRWWIAVLLLLLVAAAWLRFWRLDALPPGLFYDEAFNGLDARQLLSGDGLPLYFPANNGREPLYIYLQAISVFLFGPTAYALRLVSALAGAVTVLAVYDLARSMLLPAETRITAIHEGARRNTKKSSHFSALRVSSCAVVDQTLVIPRRIRGYPRGC